MISSRSIHVFALAALVAGTAYAQSGETASQAAPAQRTTQAAAPAAAKSDGGTPTYIKPETPEQRQARLGTAEDPGLDPSAETVFYRFGKKYRIERFERRWANYDDVEPGWVKPFGFVNSKKEIYQQNDKYVWAWMEQKEVEELVVGDASEPMDETQYARYNDEEINYFQQMRSEFSALDVPASGRTVRFELAQDGLPKTGSWRNTIAVGDMNGDGKLDVIAPSERGGNNMPAIFLGDGTGKWQFWRGVKWPFGVNYGSVDVGDFNKDGAMDIAYGVHLGGLRVFLGDNKGTFVDGGEGLPRDWATRRVKVTDLDADGDLDIVAVNEGPAIGERDVAGAKLMGFLNDGTGRKWTPMNIADPTSRFGGDWMAVGNFNGDKYPDVMAASVFFNGTDLLYLSSGKAKWNVFGNLGKVIPFLSYHFAQTAGRFGGSTGKLDDLIVSHVRFWPSNIDPRVIPQPSLPTNAGIDRISFSKDGKEAKRTPIVRWAGNRGVTGMSSGDFDGDGKLDIAYTKNDPRVLEVLLGDGRGGFTRAGLDGVKILNNPNYDLLARDVNGDERPDLIILYESAGTTRFAERDGGIQVFLNRGTASASASN
jgi:hypothetical protein